MLNCSKCKTEINKEDVNTSGFFPCRKCGSSLKVEAFPALFHEAVSTRAEAVMLDEQASCFTHTDKKAVVPCGHCGRFLCALCDMEIDDRHLCPACLQSGSALKKTGTFETQFTQYDSIALSTSILSMLFTVFTVITAPAVIFMVIRFWKAPTGVLPRTKIRFIFAFLIALAQLAFWGMMIWFWFISQGQIYSPEPYSVVEPL